MSGKALSLPSPDKKGLSSSSFPSFKPFCLACFFWVTHLSSRSSHTCECMHQKCFFDMVIEGRIAAKERQLVLTAYNM